MRKLVYVDTNIGFSLSDVDYEASPYVPAKITSDPFYSSPEEGGFECVNAVWYDLPGKNGVKVRVNILELFDEDSLVEAVCEALEEEHDNDINN